MFRFDVMQMRWLILALAGGGVLVLAVVLAYLALWRRPETEDEALAGEAHPALRTRLRAAVPWVLILTYAAWFVYAVVYTVFRAGRPPNW
jgi:hypothetical protein